MSGLIKQTQAGIAIDRLPAVRPRAVEPPPRDPRLAVLEARVAELEATLAKERGAAERAVADARAAGRDEVKADDTKRIALVERGIADALTTWRDRLAGIEGLAALLARASVAKIFGDDAELAGMVSQTLANHVERMGARAVVNVAVSMRDFADEGALAALAANAGLPMAQIAARSDLPMGACRLALRLGEVDLDPVAQWRVIEAELQAMGTDA